MTSINEDARNFWAEAKRSMPDDIVEKIDAGIEAMQSGGTPFAPLETGSIVEDFSLNNQNGERRNLAQILADGPVILFFYRGEWCPSCNLQLKHYQEALGDFEAAGARLVAISPEKPDHSLVAVEKHKLEFDILHDTDDKIGEAFGVSVRIPDEHIEVLTGFGLELPDRNGTQSWALPVPGVFLIGQDFEVKWRFVEANYRVRAEVDDLLNALSNISNSKTGE